MEPFMIHPGSCSCTGCVYKSRSKEPNVQQLLQDGSDIDKLFLGKFLPLRERKLLERLIRTRDVYDGVRNQLLCASDQTIPKHKKRRRDEDLSPEQSSAVLKMVDLVDRGQMGPANESKAKLSSCCSSCSCKSFRKIRKRLCKHRKHHKEHRHTIDLVDPITDPICPIQMGTAYKAKLDSCCSCCSCETLKKIRKRMEKEDKKHPKVHRQIVTCEDIAKYCEEAAKKGRKRRKKLSTKISKLSSRIGSERLKIKKHLSEPTVVSKAITRMKRIRSKRKTDQFKDSSTEIVARDQKTKTGKGQRRKIKKVQSRSSEDSATELRTLASKIKKDSLTLFKEKMLKKRPYDKNKYVECRPGTCKVGTCSPEECFKKIKPKGVGDTRRKHHHRYSETGTHKSHISMKIRPKNLKVRDSQVEIGKTKSSSSLTTILKTRDMPSLSQTELQGKIPVTPKPVKGKHGKALAKSAASMTSIRKLKKKAQLATEEKKVAPKLKSKAKRRHVARDEDLEKNIPVEVLRKSKMTTKPATKSTASFTSVAKEKATKARSKMIKTLERHKGEPASPSSRHKISRKKARREPQQDTDETDIQEPIENVKSKKPRRESHQDTDGTEQEPIEKVKSKKNKRIKALHGRKLHQKYKHSKTQFASASPKASKHSHLRDSASQASKPLGKNVLSKSKSQGRSALASMERLKRKSVGSAAFSQKTSSRSRTKSKEKQSKSAENFTKTSKYVSREPPLELEDNNIECYPNRQAVKISSSFSFNIEFYKDKYPCVEVDEQLDFEPPQTPRRRRKIKQTQHRRKSKDQATGHIYSRHNMSSQSGSTQSFKSTQVAHKLKRCFCTQKLIQTKKHKLNYVESKKTMASLETKDRDVVARQIRTQTKQSGIAYVVPPTTSTQASLLPYECEPDFCTPGECDPYECLERIKQRNRRAGKHVSRDTNTSDTPKKSKLASTSHSESKSTSSQILSESRKIERKRRHTQSDAHHSPRVKRDLGLEPRVSSERFGQRQAVRIGSSFNFNIEISKTNINDRVTANAMIYDRPIQMERRQMRPKGIKVYKPSVRHDISETTRNVKSKQTRTEPFLQRCLCTLKLLKKNKNKVEKLSPWRNRDEYVMHMQNGAENRYKPERSKFLPCECKPGLYVPKEYHPYDSEKHNNLRQIKLKYKYSNKCVLGCRPSFSKTSRTTSSESQNTQFYIRKPRQKVKKISRHYKEVNITPDHFKQRVMRGGSHLSSKIEFSKEKSLHYKRRHNFITTEDCVHKQTRKKHKSNTKEPQRDAHLAHHTPIDTKPKLSEKRSSVISVIKKCFSILKFPRKTNKLELRNKNDVISESARTLHPLPSSQINEYKNTCARSSKLPYNSSSHKHSRNFCISGMNTPYGHHEESKRQDIIKLDQYANMRIHKRKSVMSVSSDLNASTNARSTQSRLLKHRKEDQKLRNKQRGMKAARSFTPSRRPVIEGSNYSFNKKKSTNRSIPPPIRNPTYKSRVEKFNTVSDISPINRMKNQHCFSQENNLRKERKASDVGFFLKKCFCKLGLQKKNVPERDFLWQQPIMTQFVQVEPNLKKNCYNVTKSGYNVANKTLHTREPSQSLQEGRYVFEENLTESQNGMKNPRYKGSHHLPNSSFTRRGHIRSQIDVNFDKIKNLLNIQRINPFYQSFYALNVKVSKNQSNTESRKKSGDCAPGQCDPEDCKHRVRRLKRMKHANEKEFKKSAKPKTDDPACKDMPDPGKFECYKRCKAEFEGKKVKPPPGPDKPLILGSDLKVRGGVYKDTNPYKDGHRQAVRIGSDARVDFDFWKEPTKRNIIFTGPIPAGPIPKERQMMEGSRKSFGRKSKLEDTQPINENQKRPSGIKLMMKRLSRGSEKSQRSARSDIYQRIDEKNIICRDLSRHRSIPRLSMRRESLKQRYVQCKECAQRQEKPARKSTDRNNVTFCTDVNCLEYSKETTQKRPSITSRILGRGGDQVKSMTKVIPIQGQGKGEGDVENQYGPVEGRRTMMNCLCALKKIKATKCSCGATTAVNRPTKCKCGAKTKAKIPTKCRCGEAPLIAMKSVEEIKKEKKKRCSQLEIAERKMETIMPYSKKKFKKRESQSKLPPGTDKNECAAKCRTILKDTTEIKKFDEDGKEIEEIPDYDVRVTPSFECLCNKEARLRRLCPVCRSKAKGKFKKGKNKLLKCTCMDEEIEPEKPKDLSKCPMCKETIKKKKGLLKTKKCPCCKNPFSINDAPGVVGPVIQQPVIVEKPVDTAPRFEMLLNTTNMKIVNKEEVLKKIGQSSKEAHEKKEKALKYAKGHGSKCKCCICRGIRKGALAGAPLALKPDVVDKPCICGSVVCAKDWDKIKQEQAALAVVASKLKKCVCGSAICAEESSKMPDVLLEEARQAEHVKDLQKRAKAKEKAYHKARLQRLRARERARKKEDQSRKEQDKAEMKTIKKNEGAGDLSMIGVSLIDLGTFGSKAFCDVATTLFRGVWHPRDAITDLRDASHDPGAAARNLQKSIARTGLFSTLKRIKARFSKMPTAKRVVRGLESYPTTNYIIHMADKDPSKRMKKFKTSKRSREPVEFECSLYMSSMRKRPCLRIYYMCPWFYPHCMSILGLWKQFLDVLLFILAVAVWSPCILCMELCRGFVCCVLCQG